ncbi:uracil phosphoribosyltransferase [Apiospora arundinis]|uniref:Uracil phosphoribosyltransferase n=1 Tax=Apiospora arundinis TaxID=335852 RepID=A0ABR2I8W9_9PEZI
MPVSNQHFSRPQAPHPIPSQPTSEKCLQTPPTVPCLSILPYQLAPAQKAPAEWIPYHNPYPWPVDPPTTVIGIYGLPGSGKTQLVNDLKKDWEQGKIKLKVPENSNYSTDRFGHMDFHFYELSEMIESVVPGGWTAYESFEIPQKQEWHQFVIEKIKCDSIVKKHIPVIVGQSMVWLEGQSSGQPVFTKNDTVTFTHLLYWKVPAEFIRTRRDNDIVVERPYASVDHIRQWQTAEERHMIDLCLATDTIFSYIKSCRHLSDLLHWFRSDYQHNDLSYAHIELDEVLGASENLQTMLVLNSRILTSSNIWVEFLKHSTFDSDMKKFILMEFILKRSASARQLLLLMELGAADDHEFNAICDLVASKLVIYPEIERLLQFAAEVDHIGIFILTAGIRRILESLLKQNGLSDAVKVIGGGRFECDPFLTHSARSSLIQHLGAVRGLYVCALGSTTTDIEMMCDANQSIIVADGPNKVMSQQLTSAINNRGLRVSQVLSLGAFRFLPLVDVTLAPVIQLDSDNFRTSLASERSQENKLHTRQVFGESAASLYGLTNMHDTADEPNLHPMCRFSGAYLANHALSEVLGTNTTMAPREQGPRRRI